MCYVSPLQERYDAFELTLSFVATRPFDSLRNTSRMLPALMASFCTKPDSRPYISMIVNAK